MTAAAAFDPGRCHCSEFVLCTPEGLASTLLRLPNVSSPASPWYAYLRTVYRSLPPLPITLRGRLELLYPALLPAPVCLPSSSLLRKRQALPLCKAAVCAEWMPDPPPPSEDVANYAANGTFIMVAALNESDRRPFGHAVVLQPPIAARRPSKAATGWVEVVRQAAQCPEGWSDSGCWFHQAKGSGVWVSTSPRSLILSAHGGLWDDGRRVSSWKPLASWDPWEQANASCPHHHQHAPALPTPRHHSHPCRGAGPTAPVTRCDAGNFESAEACGRHHSLWGYVSSESSQAANYSALDGAGYRHTLVHVAKGAAAFQLRPHRDPNGLGTRGSLPVRHERTHYQLRRPGAAAIQDIRRRQIVANAAR